MDEPPETSLQELMDAFFGTANAPQRQALERAITDRCRSLIRKWLPKYLPLWMKADDYEECESDCLLKVWETIRQREKGNQKPITEGSVVRIVKNHAISLWRHLNPHKRLLHDKARKTLETDPLAQGLTLWRTGAGKQARFVAGLTAWRGQVPRILLQEPAVYAACKQYAEEHWSGRAMDADLPSLIAGVLERANAPVLLSELVELLWEVTAHRSIAPCGRPTISLEGLPSEMSTGLMPFELDRLYWSFDMFYQRWQQLDERHRRVFLLSQSPEFWDTLLMVKRAEDVAEMVGIKPQELAVYQRRLPLTRTELARLLNATPQQVSSLKQHAQRQLQAWMSGAQSGRSSAITAHRLPLTTHRPQRRSIRLTTGSARNWLPAWSPDGSTIAFLSNQTSIPPAQDLWLIAPDGSRQREAAHGAPYAGDDVFGYSLAWAGRTGDLIIYEGNWQWEIMRFRLSQLSSIPVTRARVDGSDLNFTQILSVPHHYGTETFDVSPDGKKLAWAESCAPYEIRPCRWEVRIGDLDSLSGETTTAGTVVFATSDDGYIFRRSLSFSPDGSQLCISVIRDGWSKGVFYDLYVLNLRTGKVTRLTQTGEHGVWNIYPAWSSKDLIAFVSGSSYDEPFDLYLIRPDGSGLKRLTRTRHDCVHPSWSPDGRHLVFAAGAALTYHLYVMQVT